MTFIKQNDPKAAERKRDHIELAFESQVEKLHLDTRFSYEPILMAHPSGNNSFLTFLGKKMRYPIWISSMTGGTKLAKKINQNLAKICGKYGLGMGLGSCRGLLYSDDYFVDFDVRHHLGDAPFFANLGIAQIEESLAKNDLKRIKKLLERLQVDGLIIHINPLQEWLQPEGDHITRPPIETISEFLDKTNIKVIVKEVGQGMGYESLKALLQLPLEAIDFAAHGGTNFSMIELFRSNEIHQKAYQNLALVGHSAEEMTLMTNQIIKELGNNISCQQVIISGGIRDFLDGYYLTEKINLSAIYGQASAFLKYATKSYEELEKYTELQVQGLELAQQFLKVK